MIGANNLELQITSNYLLNLDSENENRIVIGCAGGINIFGEIDIEQAQSQYNKIYRLSVSNLQGGHSGLKIDANIPNAIKVLVDELVNIECEIIEIDGGEASNVIPKNAYAVIRTIEKPTLNNQIVNIEELDIKTTKVIKQSRQILDFIHSFKQGVRAYNEHLSMPEDSINLSTIKTKNKKVTIDCFGRSMSIEGIERLKNETTELYNQFGFLVTYKDRALPWKPEITQFVKLIKEVADNFSDNMQIGAVHAGLECGIIQNKQKNT